MLINELVVEATGVELITMLTARKLLIPGSAPTAKKVQLPNPLYVYCTKMLFALDVKLPTNASAVSDAPHCKKAGRFGDVVRGASDTAV